MDVSEVRLNLLKTDNAVKAIGSFALDGMFAVRGVRVLESKDGRKDILGVWIGEHENSKFWLNVLNDLKSRGVLDV